MATVAVVLAAGLSRRFGGDKLLHPYRGKPLAAHIAGTLGGMEFADRLAICPPASPRAELFRGFEVIENHDPARGMGSSLALAAHRAIQLGADRLLVCLADMPNATREHLEAILAIDAPAVATECDGTRSPPAAFSSALFPQLAALSGDTGARPFLRDAVTVAAPLELVKDFDTPEDFA